MCLQRHLSIIALRLFVLAKQNRSVSLFIFNFKCKHMTKISIQTFIGFNFMSFELKYLLNVYVFFSNNFICSSTIGTSFRLFGKYELNDGLDGLEKVKGTKNIVSSFEKGDISNNQGIGLRFKIVQGHNS